MMRVLSQVLSEERLDEIAKTIRRKRPRCVILGGSPTAADLLVAIKELKRHRELEHDHYWGEDD